MVTKLLVFMVLIGQVGQGTYKIEGKAELVEGYAELTIPGVPADSVLWRVTPKPVKRSMISGTLVFAGLSGTTYEVEGTIIDWVNRKVSQVTKDVTFAGIPVPPDNPPKPEDPLVKSFKDAISIDPDKTLVPKFVAFFDEVSRDGGIADSSATYGEFETKCKEYGSVNGISKKAMVFQNTVANYAKQHLPWKLASDTAIDKKLVKDTYKKVKTTLEVALRSSK